jgi:hypothetical protein
VISINKSYLTSSATMLLTEVRLAFRKIKGKENKEIGLTLQLIIRSLKGRMRKLKMTSINLVRLSIRIA